MGSKSIFLSVDVEADGPIPGCNSMLSIGAVALNSREEVLGTFTENLLPLPGAAEDPDTMDFWARNPEAYAATQVDRQDPAAAMGRYLAFIKALPVRPIFVGFPAPYDFMWHHWYLHRFAAEDPCGFTCLDAKSYAAAKLGLSFRDSAKRRYPRHWFAEGVPHTHVAWEDAYEQGIMIVRMLNDGAAAPRL